MTTGGRERIEAEYRALLAAADLRLTPVVATDILHWVLEALPVSHVAERHQNGEREKCARIRLGLERRRRLRPCPSCNGAKGQAARRSRRCSRRLRAASSWSRAATTQRSSTRRASGPRACSQALAARACVSGSGSWPLYAPRT